MRRYVFLAIMLWVGLGSIMAWEASIANATGASENESRQATPIDAVAALSDKPCIGTSWTDGLQQGVNGSIPAIVVDQFGYPTKSAKVAIIRNPKSGYDKDSSYRPGREYRVVECSTGKIVKSGAPIPWNDGMTDDVSGDQIWWFDFSDVKAVGTYAIVDIENNRRSAKFDIDDHVYRRLMTHAVRMFFYQRAGMEKTAKTARASWADGASHLGVNQDPYSHSWLAKDDPAQVKDLRGGWFDAGDYNKYTSWAARNVISLLRSYAEHPSAFGDDFAIPESGNGIPDILDEAKWGLDWLERMQNADGSLLCVQSLSEASPPSAAKGPSFYGPPTTSATLMGAAVFAYASKIFAARPEPKLQAYATNLAQRAKAAWAWATANPNVLYYNNDDAKQPGSRGLASGQQEMDALNRLAAQFEAAVYLYEITRDAEYGDFAEKNFASIVPQGGPSQWDVARQEILLYYTRLPAVSDAVKSTIISTFVTGITKNADQLPMVIGNKDPYRAPIKDYTWGSNSSKIAQARLYELLAAYDPAPNSKTRAEAAALEYLHYLHGANPLGLVYLTNMKVAGAENSARTIYHAWFSYDSSRWARTSGSNPGPPPGYLVGGPNPQYAPDQCCFALPGTAAYQCYMSDARLLCKRSFSPPMDQPPSKSYLQFNEPWPADSWKITEPSTGYQAAYILALSPYAN
jgi:hypothetical protein